MIRTRRSRHPVSIYPNKSVDSEHSQNQISDRFLTNRQQIYAKWRRSSCVLVLSASQISLKRVASTSHLSPPEGKIRARCRIEQPNQCLMNIFGCYCAPYDESHQASSAIIWKTSQKTQFSPFTMSVCNSLENSNTAAQLYWLVTGPEKARLTGSFELILGFGNQLIVWWVRWITPGF